MRATQTRTVLMRGATLLFSPMAFIGSMLVMGLTFGVCSILGWREYTSVLSGTYPTSGDPNDAVTRGVTFVILYFGAIVVVPILFIAALLMYLWQRLNRRH